jgi:hypothetical protein
MQPASTRRGFHVSGLKADIDKLD